MINRSQSGQTTILVIGLALVAFAVAGLAIDGTRAFLFRRSMQNAADAAAVAAASEVDLNSLYASGGGEVRLDAEAARRQAAGLLAARSLPARASVQADARGVTIVLRARLETSFLGVVGLSHVPVAVEARAEPIRGATP